MTRAEHDAAVAEYGAHLDAIIAGFRSLVLAGPSDGDADRMARTVELADSVGFVVDATAYRDRLEDGSLRRQGELIALYRRVRRELRQIAPELAPLLDAQEAAP